MSIDAENEGELPIEIYQAQVDSMFAGAKWLAIATLASSAVALYVAVKYSNLDIGLISAVLPAIGAFRLECMRRFARRPRTGSSSQRSS